ADRSRSPNWPPDRPPRTGLTFPATALISPAGGVSPPGESVMTGPSRPAKSVKFHLRASVSAAFAVALGACASGPETAPPAPETTAAAPAKLGVKVLSSRYDLVSGGNAL